MLTRVGRPVRSSQRVSSSTTATRRDLEDSTSRSEGGRLQAHEKSDAFPPLVIISLQIHPLRFKRMGVEGSAAICIETVQVREVAPSRLRLRWVLSGL